MAETTRSDQPATQTAPAAAKPVTERLDNLEKRVNALEEGGDQGDTPPEPTLEDLARRVAELEILVERLQPQPTRRTSFVALRDQSLPAGFRPVTGRVQQPLNVRR